MLLAQRTSSLKKLYRLPIDALEELTTGLADLVVVNSQYTAAIFAQTFARLHRRHLVPQVLYPAVDCGPSRSKLPGGAEEEQCPGLAASGKVLLSINRFERKKGIDLAVKAFIELLAIARQDPAQHLPAGKADPGSSMPESATQLVIAGGYDARLSENREVLQELKAMVDGAGIASQVLFLPSFTDGQRTTLLDRCSAVVYTPQNEHFGIVPLEAMAAGKPVIACDSGGPRESVVHGRTGWLCHPTATDFASAMHSALSLTASETRAMASTCHAHVQQHFSRDAFGSKLEDCLHQLCD